MLETLPVAQLASGQPLPGRPGRPGLRARHRMQQRLAEQRRRWSATQLGTTRVMRAEHRANALGRQLEHLHVGRPGRLGVPQRGIQPWLVRVQLALAGRQLQAQLRQLAVEAVQPRDEPARQEAAGATEHERRLGRVPLQLGAGAAQPLEGLAGGLAQTLAGIGEFYAAPLFDEQGQA